METGTLRMLDISSIELDKNNPRIKTYGFLVFNNFSIPNNTIGRKVQIPLNPANH